MQNPIQPEQPPSPEQPAIVEQAIEHLEVDLPVPTQLSDTTNQLAEAQTTIQTAALTSTQPIAQNTPIQEYSADEILAAASQVWAAAKKQDEATVSMFSNGVTNYRERI